MAEEKVILPHEFYYIAYNRNILIGDMWLKEFPKPKYLPNTEYTFDFDPNAKYLLWKTMPNGDVLFQRVSDAQIAKFTKYSHINLKL